MSSRFHYPTRSQRSASRTSDRDRASTQSQSQVQSQAQSRHSHAHSLGHSHHLAPNPTPPPDDQGKTFEPCAATASFFIYAQQHLIISLRHDSLAVERRFDKHKDEVLLIAADNVSDGGAGRYFCSYDASQTAIVWDLFTGDEVARFSPYATVKTAAWMKDGSIAFGNTQGSIIVFETQTSEHSNTRTIFDPITALAPCSDCKTFAIGYQNGSILIASIAPTFTIYHTLTTSRAPSPLCGLAWHGSSSKQRADMLATQAADGVLRVWSITKAPISEPPRIIRVLEPAELGGSLRTWFAWSKNGRIVSFADGESKAWDVRTKRVTQLSVPVADHVAAIANYGPSGNLFTVSRTQGVQQYDLCLEHGPAMTKSVMNVPHNAPPTPPGSTDITRRAQAAQTQAKTHAAQVMPMRHVSKPHPPPLGLQLDMTDTSASEDEGPVLSPLQRIAKEMDDFEDERRDQLAPLSPVSSRASMSSASSYGARRRHRTRTASRASSQGSGETVFSNGSSEAPSNDSMSIRTGVTADPKPAARQQTMRTPGEAARTKHMDLFPYVKAHLSEVKFKPPRYDREECTPDVLRAEMLNVIFGWGGDIDDLVRAEQSQHAPGSASHTLLSKWLGDFGADAMAQMVGSESMSSSDWMLLALSCSMGQSSQKQIGEAFVKHLLKTDEIHPAVAILLGLGEHNEAVEVYVSRKFFLEATLLTCLCFPHDWQRISHLVRKWGEAAVTSSEPELAVRCFSCTSIEVSEAWFSPKSQDLVYLAQQQILAPDQHSPPMSPPSASSASRMTTKNASLKLITTFGDKGAPKPQLAQIGATPIADTAMTPGAGAGPAYHRAGTSSRTYRDLSETRTATPGGYKQNRLPSTDRERTVPDSAGAGRLLSRRATPALSEASEDIDTAVERSAFPWRGASPHNAIGSASASAMTSRGSSRNESRDRNKHNLHIDTGSVTEASVASPGTSATSASVASLVSRGRHRRTHSSLGKIGKKAEVADEIDALSPSSAGGISIQGYKGRSIDKYISSLEEAHYHAQQARAESTSRTSNREPREARSKSRPRFRDGSKARSDVGYAAKRSPTSPKSMTAEDVSRAIAETAVRSPVEPASAHPGARADLRAESRLSAAHATSRQPASKPSSRAASRSGAARKATPAVHSDSDDDGASAAPVQRSYRQGSPVSPVAMDAGLHGSGHTGSSAHRSSSRQPTPFDSGAGAGSRSASRRLTDRRPRADSSLPSPTSPADKRARSKSRKELAAQELEQRRLSLARRPSAPAIPTPAQLSGRPTMSPRSLTEGDILSAHTYSAAHDGPRSEAGSNYGGFPSRSGSSSVPIGLPANPKTMRIHSSERDDDGASDAQALLVLNNDSYPTLAAVSYQPATSKQPPDDGPLLPATVFTRTPPARSASAPPERHMNIGDGSPTRPRRDSRASRNGQEHAKRGHSRRPSRDESYYMHDDAADDDDEDNNIVIVPEMGSGPVLAELAHLMGPPPPPPIQHSSHHYAAHSHDNADSGIINIAMDPTASSSGSRTSSRKHSPEHQGSDNVNGSHAGGAQSSSRQPRSAAPESATSATSSSSRWARVTDRMRSSSRGRNGASAKSPNEHATPFFESPPKAPQSRRNGVERTATPAVVSAYANASAGGHSNAAAPAPYETLYERKGSHSGHASGFGHGQDQRVPPLPAFSPAQLLGSANVMRNPKEIAQAQAQAQMQMHAAGMWSGPATGSAHGRHNSMSGRANIPPASLQAGREEWI